MIAFLIGIVFTIIVAGIVIILEIEPVLQIVYTVIAFVAVFFIAHYSVDLIMQRNQVSKVRGIETTIEKFKTMELKECIREYNESTITMVADVIGHLQKHSAVLDESQFDRLIRIMLKNNSQYNGIDYHLPSQFMKAYPQYLTEHVEGIKKNKTGNLGYRIIVADPETIRKDAREADFAEFYDWHEKNKIKLHSISNSVMASILSKNKIDPKRCASGLGMWKDKFAILFGELKDKKIETQIIEKGDEDFSDIEQIYKEVIDSSKSINAHGSYSSIPEGLVKKWKDYVNPEKRWGKIKPFLYKFLEKYKDTHQIMDAASGIGVEYRFMLEDCFMMYANEYQEDMREMGKEYFEKSELDTEYKPTNHDWRDMNSLAFRNKYGGVLAIGNSLRVLQDKDGQQEAVSVFYKMLRDGGTLIIDERNYNRFITKSSDIAKCEEHPNDTEVFASLKEFSFRPTNPMYHSEDLKAIPCRINTDAGTIGFRYYTDTGTIRNMTNVSEKKIHEWEFLHGDSMEDILKVAGFTEIQKYADYDLEKKLELGENNDDAAMFVYVAKKSKIEN